MLSLFLSASGDICWLCRRYCKKATMTVTSARATPRVPKTMVVLRVSDKAEPPTTGSPMALGPSSLPEGCCMNEADMTSSRRRKSA